jgi:hypothetical protein
MTRSFRRHPFIGRGSGSDKWNKVAAHREERHRVRQMLYIDPECEILPHRKDFGDIESFHKDGKTRFTRWLHYGWFDTFISALRK